MPPRSLWNGLLSVGVLHVPVKLYSATQSRTVRFHEVHLEDSARIEHRRFCSEERREVAYEEVVRGFEVAAGEYVVLTEGREVPYQKIGRGYELDDGRQVVLTDEELAAAAPRKTRTIDIEAFVDLAAIDPIYFDHPYLLAPMGEGEGPRRAYRLRVEVMDRTELGRFVLRTKEHLVAVRVREGLLAVTTMLFHDEVRRAEGIPAGDETPAEEQVEQAVALVEALSVDWDPSRYEDRHRRRLLEIVERRAGQGPRLNGG